MALPAVIESIRATADAKREEARAWQKAAPYIRLWTNNPDGSPGLILRGVVTETGSGKFQWKKNVPGVATLRLRPENYLAEWLKEIPDDPEAKKNVVISADWYGGRFRWSGFLKNWTLRTDADEADWLEVNFVDDLQYMQYLLGPPNPLLPIPIFQFPRVLPLWGPDIWAISMMIWLNIARLEGQFLHMPDDPFDLAGWLPGERNFSTWQCHIHAPKFTDPEYSWRPWALCATRMNRMDTVIADALDDGQLTLTYRRVFTVDGESAVDELGYEVANGAVVFKVVDNSGLMRPDGNSAGGSLFGGLISHLFQFAADWISDYQVFTMGDDQSIYPDEYYQPGYRGQLPGPPAFILRDCEWSPIETSQLTWSPATAVRVIVGGDNPMMNQLLEVMFASMGGGVAGDLPTAILLPLLVGTIFAWLEWVNVARKQNLGWAHLWEIYQPGAEHNAWSLSAVSALRSGFEATRSLTAHQFTINGPQQVLPGLDFDIGHRIGSTYEKHFGAKVFVNACEEINYEWDWSDDRAPAFSCVVGQNKALMTQAERIARAMKKAADTLQNLGVHLIS